MGVGFGVLAIITEPPTTTTSTPTPSTCDRAGNKERLAEIRVLLHLVSNRGTGPTHPVYCLLYTSDAADES